MPVVLVRHLASVAPEREAAGDCRFCSTLAWLGRGRTTAFFWATLVAAAIGVVGCGSKAMPRPASRSEVPPAVRRLASHVAVLRRPQTAKDRSLPAVMGRAIRLAGLGLGFERLDATFPNLTRYIETLPGDREVFLVVYRSIRGAGAAPPPGLSILGLVIVQPDGKWENGGQPVSSDAAGATAGSLYFLAQRGPSSCGGYTGSNIVPDGVAQVRWQFPRQDAYGFVYKAPLTVSIPVVQNVAIATITARASCDRPSVVTLYNSRGQIISHVGSAANLDRITRPIRHGNPFAGPAARQRRAQLKRMQRAR